METKIEEMILTRVKLEPGEVLFVKLSVSDDIGQSELSALGDELRRIFPNNKVVVMALPAGDKIELTSVKDSSSLSSCADPVRYCSNCSCGKKEALEAKNETDSTD